MLFIPAGDPYRKASRRVSPAEVRLRMVTAAIADLPWAEVSRVEIDRPGPSYSDQTIEELAADGGEWWFIAGADVLEDLPHWRDPGRLIAAARLAIAVRPPAGRAVPRATLERFPNIESRIDWLDLPPLEVSSTAVRRRVADARGARDVESWVPGPVRAIIDELELYRQPT